MAGGYAPLGDVYKMEVYAMAERFNQRAEASGRTAPVSTSTMTKPPSAELAPDQTDQDSLHHTMNSTPSSGRTSKAA